MRVWPLAQAGAGSGEGLLLPDPAAGPLVPRLPPAVCEVPGPAGPETRRWGREGRWVAARSRGQPRRRRDRARPGTRGRYAAARRGCGGPWEGGSCPALAGGCAAVLAAWATRVRGRAVPSARGLAAARPSLPLHVRPPALPLGRRKPRVAVQAGPVKVHNLLSLPASAFLYVWLSCVVCCCGSLIHPVFFLWTFAVFPLSHVPVEHVSQLALFGEGFA